MSISTKTGDGGTTALMYGRRVSKTDPRVEAYGTVDELNAAIGVARSVCKDKWTAERLIEIQKELVILMGELAVADEDRDRYKKQGYKFVSEEMVEHLGKWVKHVESEQPKFDGWATPGATPTAAALDVARTVCRRAERRVVALGEERKKLNPEVVKYLNRLADLLWLMARREESRAN
jgi:cob(I)alamin adenosyltransferase